MQSTIIMLVEELAVALGGEFKVHDCTVFYCGVCCLTGCCFLDLLATDHSTNSEGLYARQ